MNAMAIDGARPGLWNSLTTRVGIMTIYPRNNEFTRPCASDSFFGVFRVVAPDQFESGPLLSWRHHSGEFSTDAVTRAHAAGVESV